jgi:endonuclease-3 related protein
MYTQSLLTRVFNILFKSYGYQGWWPFIIAVNSDRASSRLVDGYHPADYGYPRTTEQKLEVCLGSILTQNTNWKNAVQALTDLKNCGLFSLGELQSCDTNQIAVAIKSAGYYNQKARTIKNLASFLRQHSFSQLESKGTAAIRQKLLEIKGIGPETADCILLYALHKRSFVIDTYTKRILIKLDLVDDNVGYEALKALFESSLKKDLKLYQEYHALLVHHGKLHYSKKPYGISDRLLKF